MDLFGKKTQRLLGEAHRLLEKAQSSMDEDIKALQTRQTATEARVARLERDRDSSVKAIQGLQKNLDEIRDSAIRGEIASGQKSKDVAKKFSLSPSRIAQIAPRRKYNNG